MQTEPPRRVRCLRQLPVTAPALGFIPQQCLFSGWFWADYDNHHNTHLCFFVFLFFLLRNDFLLLIQVPRLPAINLLQMKTPL